jgi:hypothetical protein
LAEVDEARAATTARTIEEETRIICELCDLRPDDFEEDSRRTAGFYTYCKDGVISNIVSVVVLPNRHGHYLQCQQIASQGPLAIWCGTTIY